MDDSEDTNLALYDAVGNDVGHMGYGQLAGAVSASGTAKIGVICKPDDGGSDLRTHAVCSCGIALRDERTDCFKVIQGSLPPDNLHRFGSFRLWTRQLVIISP